MRPELIDLDEHEIDCYKAWRSFDTKYVIQDRIPDAIWDFEITLPKPPEDYSSIPNFGKPLDERTFPYYEDDYVKEMSLKYDKYLETGEADKALTEFLDQEWKRRYEGFFWYNGRQLEYITGHHYIFLQYWKIPVEKGGRNTRSNPYFREFHRDLGYFAEFTKRDDRAYGNVFFSFRRSGKTSYFLCDAYLDTTENKESVCYIQSKSATDSEKMMLKLGDSWRFLPSYFKPSDTGLTKSNKKLDFSQAQRKNTKSQKKEYKEVLNSRIEVTNSKESALDGEYASYIVGDEIAKAEKGLDVNERWNINKECLAVGDKIVGYSIQMSTVEDMEKFGSEHALTLWNRSGVEERLPNGSTKSGLYRIFFPAYYSYEGKDPKTGEPFMDKFGYCNVEAAKKYILDTYDALTGKDLMSYRRKYPVTINDAFTVNDSGNSYNKRNLFSQKRHNSMIVNNPLVRGNFIWKERFSKVQFRPDEDGRWEVAWMPPENDQNAIKKYGIHYEPARDYCRTGVDPYDHKILRESSNSGSDGAIMTIIKSHPMFPKLDKGWACKYVNRPESPNEFYEDILKQCLFYSSPVLIESNKHGALNWFEDKGFDGFVMHDPLDMDKGKKKQLSKGINMTSKDNRRALMDDTQSHIYDNIGYNTETGEAGFCLFNDLITDWERFEPDNWTPYDLSVAAGIALLACREQRGVYVEQGFNPRDYFKTYKTSKLNNNRF